MRRAVAGLIAALFVLAGCLGGADDPAATRPGGGPDDNSTSTPPAAPEATEGEDEGPGTVSLYVTAQGSFSEAAPTGEGPTAFPMPGFIPGLLTNDFDPLAFLGDGPPVDLAITAATVVFFYTQEHPGQTDPNFPPFGAFWGIPDSTRTFSFGEGPASLQGGEVVEVTIDLPMPRGGLVFPEASGHELWLLGGYHPSVDGQTTGSVLAASTATPTRIDVAFEPVVLNETTPRELMRETFTLEGGECFGVEGPNTVAGFTFDVPPTAAGLEVALTRTGGQGQEDADIDLFGPDGNLVAGGHTPYGDEVVRLYRPNMDAVGPGTWSGELSACGLQHGTFEVVVNVLEPVA